MAKREFTQDEIDTCIQKSSKHVAALLNWTQHEVLAHLKNGGSCEVQPDSNSLADRGKAGMITRLLRNLTRAMEGEAGNKWCWYWINKE